MSETLLMLKIREYAPANELEQENILQELMHYYILSSLARSKFFQNAAFQGGTCLRLIFGMNRFSEDLDFILKKPVLHFRWSSYLERIQKDCEADGIHFECVEKSESKAPVKKAFLKTDSINKILVSDLPFKRHEHRKIKIKLEIDTNPPKGSSFETHYIHFPVIAALTTQTLESGFANKSHALLCREYAKGRDWYDFWWYVARKVRINFPLLENALFQTGPWEGKRIHITPEWYIKNLTVRIKKIDWQKAAEDVRRFLPLKEQPNLELWTRDFFLYQVRQLHRVLAE